MLVLSRKFGQTIIINDNIRVTFVSVRGSQVRIGIDAPASVPILREELCATDCPAEDRKHAAAVPAEKVYSRPELRSVAHLSRGASPGRRAVNART
jgi:carbon storage regulator